MRRRSRGAGQVGEDGFGEVVGGGAVVEEAAGLGDVVEAVAVGGEAAVVV